MQTAPTNTIDTIFGASASVEEFSDGYLDYLTHIACGMDRGEIASVIRIFQATYKLDRQIFFIGNGGSAATASHFATDLGKGTKIAGVRPFRAISLTDNMAYLTAQGNDHGYNSIFVGQLENLLNQGDVVVGISASGNSESLVEAFVYARARAAITVGVLGFDGGRLKSLSDACILVRTPMGEYGPVEDIHMVLDHLMTNYLGRWLAKQGA